MGVRRDRARYRVNVGIVNLDSTNAQTFQITDPAPLIDPPIAVFVTLPPRTMQQVPLDADSDVQRDRRCVVGAGGGRDALIRLFRWPLAVGRWPLAVAMRMFSSPSRVKR